MRSRDAQLRELRRQLHALLRCAPHTSAAPTLTLTLTTAPALLTASPSTTTAAAGTLVEEIEVGDADSSDSSDDDNNTNAVRVHGNASATRPPLGVLCTNTAPPVQHVTASGQARPLSKLQRLSALKARTESLLCDEAP